MNSRRSFLQKSLSIVPFLAFPKLSWKSSKELPNVLLLGDSISIGYTPYVKQFLSGRANVLRPVYDNGKAENCQGTTNGIKNIRRWLGNTSWDVIHFNFGLHDLKHVDPSSGANSTDPAHPQQANLKQYKKNLAEIVAILIETEAKLVFATTTPYPDKVDGPLRKPGMPEKYNNAALKIMNKHQIAINNLHAFVMPRIGELQKPHNVHFTNAGSQALAQKVADRIEEALDGI